MTRLTNLALLLALLLTACQGTAETAVSPLAADTGIPVADVFAPFHDRFGGAATFGYPITDLFPLADADVQTQYFQMLRLDYDPALPVGQRVRVFPLGRWAFGGVASPEPAPTSADGPSRAFPETGYAVQDAFLAFYDEVNGAQLLGPPISPQLDEAGLRVQYFENARLEWRPELPMAQRVQITPLGQAHFAAEMVFQYEQFANAQPAAAATIRQVSVTAAVKSPVLFAGEAQRLYVTAVTPDGRFAPDLAADVAISWGSISRVQTLPATDERGQIQATLDLTDVPPGETVQLVVTIYAVDGSPAGSTRLGFRTWW